MLKVLIADRTVPLCAAVADAFEGRYMIDICHDGRVALQKIRQWKPDILWLDLMLPGVDGLTILKSAEIAGLCPSVIASSCFISESIQEDLVRYGVEYLLSKPCTVAAALSRIESLAGKLTKHNETTDPKELVYQILLMLGAVGKRSGHLLLHEAILQIIPDPNMQITKVLYPLVAQIYGGTPERVERAIRNAISSAWESRDPQVWEFYFPQCVHKCPSNGIFIGTVADYARQKLQKAEYTSASTENDCGIHVPVAAAVRKDYQEAHYE